MEPTVEPPHFQTLCRRARRSAPARLVIYLYLVGEEKREEKKEERREVDSHTIASFSICS
jgi:hypothetical protein